MIRYSLPLDELIVLADKMEGVSGELKKTALMTTLAILILERITTFEGKCVPYIKKAEKWLKTNAPQAEIEGKPLREVLESVIDFQDLFSVKPKKLKGVKK